MMKPLKILILEDSPLDAELLKEELNSNPLDFVSKVVDTKTDFEASIKSFKPNLILSDYSLPQFTGFEALEIAKEVLPHIPFILVTGHLSEEIAADSIKKGAWDYVLKTNLIRIHSAIENAFRLKEEKDANVRTRNDLRKLFAAVEQSGSVIIITDIDGNIEYTNPKFTELSGYTAEEVLGENPRILKSDLHPKEFYNTMWETIKSGKIWKGEFQNITKSGQIFWEMATISPVIDSKGDITNFLSVKEDFSERKKNEIELRDSYKEISRLKQQLELENISLKEEISLSFNYENMVYSSVEISDVLTQVEQVANTDATVLILGETGTGKELVAKAIHNISNRKNRSLIRVNCAAIPTELLESELFGHKKGSFTGAIKDRIGKFQLADGGTIFLDEIGEMPMDLQPKLLRAIQEGEIEPIGSSENLKLDLRIIAATNKELEKEVDANQFRQDLFFRLNVFPIKIPPLRERIEDIPVLVDYFLKKFCKRYDKKIDSISKTTLQQLKVYNWPGNVRELENIIERAVITSDQDVLVIQGFDNSIHNKHVFNSKTSLEEIQCNHIIKTLNLTQWKISGKGGAAELLDIKPSTLRDRMKKFGIKRPKQ